MYFKRPSSKLDQQRAMELNYSYVTTDAICRDETLSQLLLPGYFERSLTQEEGERFERHMQECSACVAVVANWNNIGDALLTINRAVGPVLEWKRSA